jgi:L-fuculose-phosphate aldolase
MPPPMPEGVQQARERVAAASRRLAADGLVLATAGNVSERVGQLVAVTPTGAVLGELEADQVVVVGLDGQRIDGEREPTSELALHLGIYERYGAGAVVHTHSPVATALACVLDELPVVHYHLLALGGAIRVAPYATFGSPELAAATLEALEGRRAALMANHGQVAHGDDLAGALQAALLLEWGCEVYWRAAQLGRPRTLGEREQGAVLAAALSRGYAGLAGGGQR